MVRMFHPVVQEVARALGARRDPPPPFVPPMKIEVVRRYAYMVLEHPTRREIAESLLVIAMRLDVLGFTKPRNQVLLLVGCGMSAAEITDSLERRRAGESGAQALMEKARSTSATSIERILAQGGATRGLAGGVSMREQHKTKLQSRREQLLKAKQARLAGKGAKAEAGGEEATQVSGAARPRRQEDGASRPDDRTPPGPSGTKGRG